jgi:hypothetical protein
MMQKFLANAIVVIAAGSLSLSAIGLPSQVRSEPKRQTCEAAIANGRERITTGRSVTIASFNILDDSQTYPDHPDGRPQIVRIRLDGKAADEVMNSPVFQKAIASEIINSCGSVGAVNFQRNQTDWSSTFGLMPNGTIKQFECVEPGPGRNRVSWGQESCV